MSADHPDSSPSDTDSIPPSTGSLPPAPVSGPEISQPRPSRPMHSDVVPAATSKQLSFPGLDLQNQRVLLHQLATPSTLLFRKTAQLQEMSKRDSVPGSEIHVIAQEIEELCSHIASLIKSAKEASSHQIIYLSSIVQNIADMFQGVHYEIDESSFVVGNNTEMREILFSLLENAFKAVKLQNREPRIHLSVVRKDGRVIIFLQDNGPGLAEGEVDKIFTPGYSTTNGEGIGLKRSQKLVTHMGGSLRLVNNNEREDLPQPSMGLTAIIDLPDAKIPGEIQPEKI